MVKLSTVCNNTLKKQSYKCVVAKILYCNKRDGENVGHIIRNLVILNGYFKWRNSGPYQIGHNKRLVILSVVIKSGAYCTALIANRCTTKFSKVIRITTSQTDKTNNCH